MTIYEDAQAHGGIPEGNAAKAVSEETRNFTVEVLYDGVKKQFEVRSDEKIQTLLDEAKAAFGALPDQHRLSLFKDGTALPDSETLKTAGVKPGDVLLLRPNEVKGG